MVPGPGWQGRECAFGFASEFIAAVNAVEDWVQLHALMRELVDEMGFRHFALVTHEDLTRPRPGQVNLRDYPEAVSARIIDGRRYRRDPVMRGCVFADRAFLWSGLRQVIKLDHHDRIALELGARDGLEEGISVPCPKFGHCLGSCTFAGLKGARRPELVLGIAQMVATFAFARARQLAGDIGMPAPLPRLEPRLRDCVVLVGQGVPDKLIAHRLGLTHRTVESYLRDARRLFDARDRVELVIAALLAGEVSLDEIGKLSRTRNPGRQT